MHTLIEARKTKTPVTRLVSLCSSCPGYCCKNDMIILHPECGDRIEDYPEREEVSHPLTGKTVWQLKHKPNGDCIHLGERGCEIYATRPMICREYDCGDQYAKMTRADRRSLVSRGLASKAQFDQGRRVYLARAAGEP